MLKIVNDFPPNYEAICKAFPFVRTRRTIIFTYGDACYVPSGVSLPYHLRVHEATHVRQQTQIGAAEWWKRYLADPQFRLEQEVEAYGAQYHVMSKPERDKHIRRIAGDLAGPIYGNIVTFDEAKQLIREAAKRMAAAV